MDSKDKWRLRSNRRSLMDIDASMICMRLISVGIITPDDSERICRGATHQDKAEALLNMLETKGEEAYGEFVEALSPDWSYLVPKLDQTKFSKMPKSLKEEANCSGTFGASGSASASAGGSDTTDRGKGNIIMTSVEDEELERRIFHDEKYAEYCRKRGRGPKRRAPGVTTSINVTGNNNIVLDNSAVTITHYKR